MEMKALNLDAVKEIRDLARKNDRNYFNFVSELEKNIFFLYFYL